MRSRYSAYALRLVDYLRESWDAATRPSLRAEDFDPATKWLDLRVLAHRAEGDSATVEFVAVHRTGGGRAKRLHERSRFRRIAGRWFYVDGDILV